MNGAAARALARPGDACVRWDMRRDMDPDEVLDVEERLQRDPARPPEVASLPDPRQWASGLAQGVMEILQGLRPLTQLRRWVVPALYEELEAARGRAAPATGSGNAAPGSGPPTRVAPACRAQSAHAWPVREGVVEVCVTVRVGARTRAVAMRLEDFRGRWLATALDVG
ncbi:MAG: Rv3235 family protein [Actinomyces sp.]|jgi:hypothetical protein|nr:Rv3235 family protein [Actinomyces sp.]MCI1640913.1 Rv3235 family protein [Actinomyces sp.]MCI1661281.1 Rv3235 family protein [Actinomyces sp.]MCI1690289.1 Rv3235 family protein [Actinomyces sp.]MCI1786930.1 Rv3235 family protein [Actinomyces sp.]MCI1829504.1 Rv3235 family protein [Actinomyces sp.]